MSQELQANTAVKVRIGPAVAVGDGFTPVTNLALSCDEAELLKHNGVATVDISGSTWAAISDCDGWYDLTLSTTDTNTEGLLDIVINDDSLCLPIHARFMVLAQAAWLSKYTAKDSGLMGVDLVNIAGSAVSTSSAQLGVNLVNIAASAVSTTTAQLGVNAVQVSGSGTAADNVEAVFLGTGHTGDVDLSARSLKLDCDTDVALEILSSDDSAIKAVSSASGKHGMELAGNVAGSGLSATGGTGGAGIAAVGGSSSGAGIKANASANNDAGMELVKHGTGKDLDADEGISAIIADTEDLQGNVNTMHDTDLPAVKSDTEAIIADTEDLQTQVGTDGAGLTDLGGMSTTMKGQVESEVDDSIAGLNNLSSANVTTACTSSLNTYDPPKRSEATTDKNSIITEVNANETKIDALPTAAANADAVWNEATTGHTSSGTFGEQAKTDIDAILTDTATLPSFPQKNVALTAFTFFMVLTTDHITAATGKTIVAQISKDGGAFATCTNAVSEISAGFYKINFTQAEMNATVIALKFTNTDCDTQALTIVTSA